MTEIKPINDQFLKGVTYTFEFFPEANSDKVKVAYKTEKHVPKQNRNITLKLDPEFRFKMQQACNGGTDEKKNYLSQNSGRIV